MPLPDSSQRRSPASRSRSWIPVFLLLAIAVAQAARGQECPADAKWVNDPEPPNLHVDPGYGLGPCGFYRVAWQAFLYLTVPESKGGVLRFETLPSSADFPELMAALEESSSMGKATFFLDSRQNDRTRVFQVRGSEPKNDFEQPGVHGILVDQNGNVTYYEQFFNDEARKFITSCKLNIKACQEVPAARNLRFPAGSIEVKVSWRVLPKGTPNEESYYRRHNISVYNPNTHKTEVVTLGLAGYHLVYATPGHPEMVWATFEHIANAPDGPCTGSTIPPHGFKGWAFNNREEKNCNKVNYWPSPPPEPPYPKTQAFRNWAFGSSPGDKNAQIIKTLNSNVLSILPANDWRRNYFLVGAIWTNGSLPAIPPTKDHSNEIGSLYLANSSLETFTQFPNPAPSPPPSEVSVNCFSCHNARTVPGNPPTPPPFAVSHTLRKGKPGACPYTDKLPAVCQQTQSGPHP